jgi:hypothetical protein
MTTTAPNVTRQDGSNSKGKAKKLTFSDSAMYHAAGVVIPDLANVVGVIEPSVRSIDMELDKKSEAKKHLVFDEATLSFTCHQFQQPCTIQRERNTGLLMSVRCKICKVSWSYSKIPIEWRLVKLWTTKPDVLPAVDRKDYRPPPIPMPTCVGSDSATSITFPTLPGPASGSKATGMAMEEIPDWQQTLDHLNSAIVVPNFPNMMLPINQTALSVLLREVTDQGWSKHEARLPALLFGLSEAEQDRIKRRLELRRNMLKPQPHVPVSVQPTGHVQSPQSEGLASPPTSPTSAPLKQPVGALSKGLARICITPSTQGSAIANPCRAQPGACVTRCKQG